MNNLSPQPQRQIAEIPSCGQHLEKFKAARFSFSRLQALVEKGKRDASNIWVNRKENGDLFIKLPKSDEFLTDPQLPQIPSNPDIPVFILGIGNGKSVDALLSELENPLMVIEPEINLLWDVSKYYDWHKAIEAGRLYILVPDMTDSVLGHISLQECVAEIQHQMIRHRGNAHWVVSCSYPLNEKVFKCLERSVSFFADFITYAADCTESVDSSQGVDDVLVVSPQCRIFDDLARCFSQLGLKTQLYRVPDALGKWDSAQWRDTFWQMRQKPGKVTLVRNRTMLETEKVTERYHWEHFMPGRVVSWWWDIPNVASMIDLDYQARGGKNTHFAFARDIADLLPGRTEWLPAGALTPFTNWPVSLTSPPKPDLPVTFVGQSRLQLIISNLKILHQALRHLCGREGSFLSADIERMHNILELYDYLQTEKQDIVALIRSIESGCPKHAYYLDYIFQMILTGLFRMAAILTIRKAALPLMVFGDDGWLKSGIVEKAAFKGLIAPGNLPELYQRSAVNLNLNFMQVSSTVNPKVLDACAAGGTVLTDYRPELDELFPDPDVRPFHFCSLKELPARVQALLQADLTEYRMKLLVYTRRRHSLLKRARHLAHRLNLLS